MPTQFFEDLVLLDSVQQDIAGPVKVAFEVVVCDETNFRMGYFGMLMCEVTTLSAIRSGVIVPRVIVEVRGLMIQMKVVPQTYMHLGLKQYLFKRNAEKLRNGTRRTK